ncbi:MAG: tetratricopeptide repeat protein [Planctomycetes bacterium]|nr:tetratricopeptide repeat protein [Planctomycetota bacterium]
MRRRRFIWTVLVIAAVVGLTRVVFGLDELRNVKRGAKVPHFELPTFDGRTVKSEDYEGKVLVILYLLAQQGASSRAAVDAHQVVQSFAPPPPEPENKVRAPAVDAAATAARNPVQLLLVTADVVHKAQFEQMLAEAGITATFAMDADRRLYRDLGLIVFPTTVIVGGDGRLAHVISTRTATYEHVLDAYLQHTLGRIDDAHLEEILTSATFERGSPKSIVSRHRTAARLLREKGILDGAESELRAALEIEPKNIYVRLDLADLEATLGKTAEAATLVDAVLQEDPHHRRAKLIRGIVFFKEDQLDRAESLLTEALVLNPDPARTHYYLGLIAEKRGEPEKALEHYRQAIHRLLGE